MTPHTPRRFDESDLATIRDQADLIELVTRHGVDLRRSGSSHKGLCPFHDERTPSFSVRPTEGTYHCFGCGESGDAISFVMATSNMSFPEAVRSLAARLRITLREDDDPETQKALAERKETQAALEATQELFTSELPSHEATAAREDLTQRGFTRDHAERFGCGYAPTDPSALRHYLAARKISVEAATRAGVLRRTQQGRIYPMFRGRLTFPIRDGHGTLAGFGARRLSANDPVPGKYVNSPDGPMFHKTELLYGWDTARKAAVKAGRVLIVEGYTDVMAAHTAGIGEAVAACGTAFGERHLRMLTRGTPSGTRIVFAFDPDTAGVAAARRAWEATLPVANRCCTVPLPGSDPCDIYRDHGASALAEALSAETPLTLWLLERVAATHEATPEGASQAAEEIADLIKRLPDPVMRDGYRRTANDRWGTRMEAQPHVATPPRAEGPATDAPGWVRLQRRVAHRLFTDPVMAYLALTTPDAPALEDRAAAAVLTAAREAAKHVDPTTSSARAWAGAMLDSARATDTSAAVQAVFDVDDPDTTSTDDLIETLWDHVDDRTQEQQLQDLIAKMRTASGDEADRLWATYQQLTAEQ